MHQEQLLQVAPAPGTARPCIPSPEISAGMSEGGTRPVQPPQLLLQPLLQPRRSGVKPARAAPLLAAPQTLPFAALDEPIARSGPRGAVPPDPRPHPVRFNASLFGKARPGSPSFKGPR